MRELPRNYCTLSKIHRRVPTVIVDMSGNGKALSMLHAHLGNNMLHCANVGVAHYAENHTGPGFIAERSALFFAPAHIQKRRADWGPGVFEEKVFLFWHKAALHSRAWLKFDRVAGLAGMQAAYWRVLSGESAPDRGVVVTL